MVCAGPAEQSMEEEWQKLQEHPDILAAAPDDEVLAEMLALQVSILRALREYAACFKSSIRFSSLPLNFGSLATAYSNSTDMMSHIQSCSQLLACCTVSPDHLAFFIPFSKENILSRACCLLQTHLQMESQSSIDGFAAESVPSRMLTVLQQVLVLICAG